MKSIMLIFMFLFAFLFVANDACLASESNDVMYHSVKKYDNVVSTSYFKRTSSNGDLIPFKKKVNTLDESGACVSKITYVFDLDSKLWKPFNKKTYTYSNEKLTHIEHFEWDEKKDIWDEPIKSSYVYTDDGVLVK